MLEERGGGVRGVFITMEGVEGSGKSTQLRLLAERLAEARVSCRLSREPGGTPLGAELRRLLLEPRADGERWCPDAELLLFYADRAQHLDRVVRPALAAGQVVLVDRFEDSTRAYQVAQGVDPAFLERVSEGVLKGTRPELTLLLDLDSERGLARVEARNGALGSAFRETRFDAEALAFHRKVREAFRDLATREPARVRLVAADRAPEAVAEEIWHLVAPLLRAAGHGAA